MKQTEYVRRDDIFLAWNHFCQIYDDDYSFESFVDYPLLLRRVSGDTHTYFNMTEAQARKINMLLSIHYRAVVKAWLACNETS